MTEQQREFQLIKKPKVAIVGCADSREEANFNDPDFEFWGVNNLFMTMPGPWSRWFELHTITHDGKNWLRKTQAEFRGQKIDDYLAKLQQLNIPIYMQHPCSAVTNAVLYPIDEIVKRFGNYFTNTISYMIALALISDFEEIHILGVDMAVDSEYGWQRPSCEYFIGLAKGMGKTVYIPETCDLLKTRYLYAFHELREVAFNKKLDKMGTAMKKRREKAIAQMEHAEKQRKFFERQMYEYNGALATRDQILSHWGNTVDMWPSEKQGGKDEIQSD